MYDVFTCSYDCIILETNLSKTIKTDPKWYTGNKYWVIEYKQLAFMATPSKITLI